MQTCRRGGIEVAGASKAVKLLRSYGYEEGTYRRVSEYINAGNAKKTFITFIMCTCIFAAMGILRLLNVTSDTSLMFYAVLTVLSLVGCFAVKMLQKKYANASTLLFYFAFTLVIAYVIEIGVIGTPNDRTVTICLLLCAAPSLLTDRPWRVVVASALAAAAFIVTGCFYKSPDVFSSDVINTLCSLGLGLVMGLSAQRTRIEGYVDRYAKARAAKMDGLTGILNKTAFIEETSFMIEAGMTGALLIMDADNFKHVNDTYGHAKGDDVIRAIGQSIDINRRGGDIAGRYGGDEFCVLLVGNIPPETPQNYFNRLINTYREQCPQDVVKEDGSPLTLSCGAALIRPGYTFESAFAIADSALYEAKQARNNVIVVR